MANAALNRGKAVPRISEDVFEEFGALAGREFGYRHGAKKRIFLKLWEAYKASR